MKKEKKIEEPEYPRVIETFYPPGAWDLSRLSQSEPSSFNGWVRVEKYRVIVEKIDEPIEIIHERLERLWVECDNHHQWQPLESTARRLGYTFKGERGSLRTKPH